MVETAEAVDTPGSGAVVAAAAFDILVASAAAVAGIVVEELEQEVLQMASVAFESKAWEYVEAQEEAFEDTQTAVERAGKNRTPVQDLRLDTGTFGVTTVG